MIRPIAGKYELLEKLGSGGMADVYLARYVGIGRVEKLVVVKVILPRLSDDENFVTMFLDEARTAADLRHPHVVSIYEVGRDGDDYYLAMEYLQGRNVRQIWKRTARLKRAIPWGQSIKIVMDTAHGLDYAHRKKDLSGRAMKIIHRDVSPQNILVTKNGIATLLDFGIAKARSKTTVTSPGLVRGKAEYMSPEQACGEELDARSDQFSLGILLYELTTGRRLFRRDNDAKTMRAILEHEVPSPMDFMDYSAELQSILLKSLSAKREQRFESCSDFGYALEEFLREERIAHSTSRLAQFMVDLFGDELTEQPQLEPTEDDPPTEIVTPLGFDTTIRVDPEPVDHSTDDPSLVAEIKDFLTNPPDDDTQD